MRHRPDSASRRVARGVVAVLMGFAVTVGVLGAAPASAQTSRAASRTAATGVSTVGSMAGFSPGGGFLWLSDHELNGSLDAAARSGAQWLRVDFPWSAIEPQQGRFDWRAVDRVVSAARAHGIKVLALPTYTPAWARRAGTTSEKYPPLDPRDFAAFTGAAARRYDSSSVAAWEIWNEPNISSFWQPVPQPAAYARLLRAAYRAIHAVRPNATVLSGGLSPATTTPDGTRIAPLRFLQAIYRYGAGRSFDALGVHPYSFPAMPLDAATADWNTYLQMPRLHRLLAAHGHGARRIWATETGAPTGTSADAVSEQRQADIVRLTFRPLVDGRWTWMGPIFVYSMRDGGTNLANREDNFGLLRQDFSPKPAWGALTASLRRPLAASLLPRSTRARRLVP